MTIAGFRIVPYDLPLARPYVWARGTSLRRRGLLVALARNDGVVGWGEVAPPPDEPWEVEDLHGHARILLDRFTAGDGDRFLEALDALSPWSRLRAGLASAWHDGSARAAGMTLAQHLAGPGVRPLDSVAVNALVVAETPRGAAEAAAQARSDGFACIKLKGGRNHRSDVLRVQAVRQAIGGDLALRLDVNASWDTRDALRRIQSLEPFRLEYVEQPLPAQPLEALAALRRKAGVPIALDESASDLDAIRRIHAIGAADVVVLKPQRLGGVDRVAQALAFLSAHGLPGVVTNSLETAVGRAHALQAAALAAPDGHAHGLATEGYLKQDVSPHGPRPRAGRLHLPDVPGIGFEIEDHAAAMTPLGGP